MKISLPKRIVPIGAGVAALILVGVLVGTAQFQTVGGAGSGAPAAVSSAGPSDPAEAAPQSAASGAGEDPAPSAGATTSGSPAEQSAEPSSPAEPSAPAAEPSAAPEPAAAAPPAAAPPATAPAPAPAADAPADAGTVQRLKDSCSRRLESDAASSGVVAGSVVGRPFTLVAVEFVGAPQRSAPNAGLASYDVTMSVTTQMANNPSQTGERVCRVYDYDSHVDWLPAG